MTWANRLDDALLDLDQMSLKLDNLALVLRGANDQRLIKIIQFVAGRVKRARQQIADAIGQNIGESAALLQEQIDAMSSLSNSFKEFRRVCIEEFGDEPATQWNSIEMTKKVLH